jgi:ammonium transporter, Amt family
MTRRLALIPFIVLMLVLVFSLIPRSTNIVNSQEFNPADIAWMLTSSALVLIMTPGLAFLM